MPKYISEGTGIVGRSECYRKGNAEDYRGYVSVPVSGSECQRWTSQYPHKHTRTPANYPTFGLGNHNYCRNPDDEKTAWCYTTNPLKRWEYCNADGDGKRRTGDECFNQANAVDYRGVVSQTVSGKTCQRWTSQYPQSHTRTPYNYPTSGLGDHSFCRNPDNSKTAWCYTTDSKKRWEYCNVGKAGSYCECYKKRNAYDYRGSVSVTVSRKKCQRWSSVTTYRASSLGDHNFCRSPLNLKSRAWCYTNVQNAAWEYCNVENPGDHCECYTNGHAKDYRGFVSVTKSGKKCQQWTSQSPHKHTRTPENYPTFGLGNHNYCRSPDNVNTAWCYTTDSSKRWEYCNVGNPKNTCG
ncbi:plasminogen-like [Antedon mediterranea]|uniref:plasminogen-like n=1 Tax=Antedon mediterranea TaxID=105859 RepID=UPI003AF5F65C